MPQEPVSKQILSKLAKKKETVDKIRYGKVSFGIQDGKVVISEYTESEK